MSFFTQASFVMDPNVYGVGKLYVPKPTDGSGDLTFTRASNGTRVNQDGLIEKVRTNLLLQSDSFTNIVWVNGDASIAASGSEWSWTANTNSTYHFTYQAHSYTSSLITYSIYAKAGAYSKFNLQEGTTSLGAWFDLSSGTLGTVTAGVTAKISDEGSGWYRVSISFTSSGTSNFLFAFSATETLNYTGSGTIGGYIKQSQLETGDIATDYIATTTAAVSVGATANTPRLNYSNGCPSLLLEPQRLNAFTYSESFDNAAWIKTSTTLTANDIVSPDGYQNADKVEAFSASQLISQTPSLTAGQPFVFSVFAKAGNWGILRIGNQASGTNGAWFNLNTGTAGTINGGTSEIISYGNGWYRLIAKFSSFVSGQCFIGISDADGSTTTPAAGSNLYLWGAQLEAGSYATSYIPTLSSAVTRVADAAYKTSMTSVIGQTEGTLFCDFNVLPSTLAGSYYLETLLSDGTANNKISMAYYGTGRIQFVAFVGGSLVVNINLSSYGLTVGKHKFALAYKLNDYVAYVDGVLVGTDTSATVPAMSALNLYDTSGGTHAVNQALVFKTRLSNADLARLTSL